MAANNKGVSSESVCENLTLDGVWVQFLVQIHMIFILNEIGVIGHGISTYCNANESCDEIIDENTEHTKHFGSKITEKNTTNYVLDS